jgi:hypothetical protein
MSRTSVELFERGDSLFMRQGDTTIPVQHGAAGELFIGGTRLAFYRLENGNVVYVYNGSRALARQP